MPSHIPERDEKALIDLFSLPEPDAIAFVNAVAEAPISLHIGATIDAVVSSTTLDRGLVSRVIQLLSALQLLRARESLEATDLADMICRSAESTGKPELQPTEQIKQRIEALLSLRSLFVTTKAIGVAREQQASFCSARIVTDVRPIFDEREEPAAAVVLHSLRVTYHDSTEGALREFFLALGSDDIDELQNALSRAKRKAASIGRLVDPDVPILELEFHGEK